MRTPLTAACVSALALACAGSASAAVYTPTTFEDSSGVTPAHCPPDVVETDPSQDCSVRDAVAAARQHPGDDTVKLSAGRYLLKGGILIDGDGSITVQGAGARATTLDTQASQNDPGVTVVVSAGAKGTLTDLAITGAYSSGDGFIDGSALLVEQDETDGAGSAALRRVHIYGNQSDASGGAISNQGTLTIDNSLIERNTAAVAGGAIANDGDLEITNSTLSGNKTLGVYDPEAGVGGAIDHTQRHNPDATLKIDSSTITDNTAAGHGGGLATTLDNETTVRNTIISGNHVPDGDGEDYPNCVGTPTSAGHNLEDGTSCGFGAAGDKNADPKLAPLADNGGPTNTHALNDGSAAIDAGPRTNCVVDQREYQRVVKPCDIGAFETHAEPLHTDPPPPPPHEPVPHDGGTNGQQPTDGGPITTPGQPHKPSNCRDKAKPLTTLKRRGIKVTAKGITLTGTSVDAKACPSGVERVQVSLAKVSGTDLNCRFISKPNRFVLTPFRNCRKPVLFNATGTSKWTYTYKLTLAPGKYRAQARGFDAARNKETPTKRRNIVYFTVR